MKKTTSIEIAESEKGGKVNVKPWQETFNTLPTEVRVAAKQLARRRITVQTLRDCLRTLRRSAGLGQVEMARRMGVTQPTLSQIERQDDVKLSTLQNFAAAAGAKVSITVEHKDGTVSVFNIANN